MSTVERTMMASEQAVQLKGLVQAHNLNPDKGNRELIKQEITSLLREPKVYEQYMRIYRGKRHKFKGLPTAEEASLNLQYAPTDPWNMGLLRGGLGSEWQLPGQKEPRLGHRIDAVRSSFCAVIDDTHYRAIEELGWE